MWDLIVSVPDHCLSFYFSRTAQAVFSVSRGSYPEPWLSFIKWAIVQY